MADKGDLSGVDLDKTIKDTNTQNKDQIVDSDTGDVDLGSFKGTKELMQGYKEIQGAFTRTTQENKALKEKLAALESDKDLSDQASFVPDTSPASSSGAAGDDFDPYDPKTFDARVAQVAANQRISEVLAEEHMANPAEFNERYGYVKMLGTQHPNLTQTAAGVKKLFGEADKLRIENAKKSADKAMEHLFGRPLTDEDKTKIRGIIGEGDTQTQTDTTTKPNAGYMPDSTSSVRTGSDVNTKPDLSAEIEEAKKAGDHVRVTELLMQQALEK